jgi:hypothetical protein
VAGETRNWPVTHQAFALLNLLSRFVVRSEAKARIDALSSDLKDGPLLVESFDLYVDFPDLPDQVRFKIEVLEKMGKERVFATMTYDLEASTFRCSEANWRALHTFTPGSDGKPGVLHISVRGVRIQCGWLDARITQIRSSVEISHKHRIAERKFIVKNAMMDGGYAIAEVPTERTGPADSFKIRSMPKAGP